MRSVGKGIATRGCGWQGASSCDLARGHVHPQQLSAEGVPHVEQVVRRVDHDAEAEAHGRVPTEDRIAERSTGDVDAPNECTAAFGPTATPRLEPWLPDPRLAAFAVRAIEQAAAMPGAQFAARAALDRANATGALRADIDAALARLGGRVRTLARPKSRRTPGPGAAAFSAAEREPAKEPEDTLVRAFEAAMLEVYEAAKREAGYHATRFLQKVRRDGGLETARYLLRQPGVSQGFIGLWKAAKLDLAMEYVVLQPEYAPLFSDAELAVARRRLIEHGMKPEALR